MSDEKLKGQEIDFIKFDELIDYKQILQEIARGHLNNYLPPMQYVTAKPMEYISYSSAAPTLNQIYKSLEEEDSEFTKKFNEVKKLVNMQEVVKFIKYCKRMSTAFPISLDINYIQTNIGNLGIFMDILIANKISLLPKPVHGNLIINGVINE